MSPSHAHPIRPWLVVAGLAASAAALAAIGTVIAHREPAGLTGSIFGAGQTEITLSSSFLQEISGLEFSRVFPGALWVNQDAGGGPEIFLNNSAGFPLKTQMISDIDFIDFEDLAYGPLPGGEPFGLFIGDIGDNDRTNANIQIVVLDERDTQTMNPVAPVRVIDTSWPGNVQDAESLMVSWLSGDIYLMTKDPPKDISAMFRIPFDEWTNPTGDHSLLLVGVFDFDGFDTEDGLPNSYGVTGATFDPAMEFLALRTRHFVYLYELGRDPDAALFNQQPVARLPTTGEPQGEGVAFDPQGRDLFTSSEISLDIRRYPRLDPPTDGVTLR